MRDDTPEHTKRNQGRQRKDGAHPDILAAYAYVDSVCHTANLPGPAWYGWAIREAFLAGISHAAASPAAGVAAAFGSAPDLPEPQPDGRCPECKGTGDNPVLFRGYLVNTCDECEGTGRAKPCAVCKGRRVVQTRYRDRDGFNEFTACRACTGRAGGGGHE